MKTTSKPKTANRPPISKHPLFPAVVALWFGALFGLGSLVIRGSLIETALISASIDTLIPAAAPPIGMKARIILALGMAIVGAILGIFLARMVARDRPAVRERRRSPGGDVQTQDAQPHANYTHSAADESLADQGQRRRPLTVEEVPAIAMIPRDGAPLPGGGPQIFQVSDIPVESDLLVKEASAPAAAPTSASLAEAEPEDDVLKPFDLDGMLGDARQEVSSLDEVLAAEPEALDLPDPVVFSDPAAPAKAEIAASYDPVAERQEFSPPSSVFTSAAPQPVFNVPPVPSSDLEKATPTMNPPLSPSAQRLADADVSTLSPLELVERLAIAMRQRSGAAAVPSADQAAAPAPVFQPLQALSAVAAQAPQSVPAALRPLDLAVPEEVSAEALSHIPDRRIAMPVAFEPEAPVSLSPEVHPQAPQPSTVFELDIPQRNFSERMAAMSDELSAQAESDEGNYSSLLNMGQNGTGRQTFVRIEEASPAQDSEPVVIFPGQGMRPSSMFQAAPAAQMPSADSITFSAPSAAPPADMIPPASPARFDQPNGGGEAFPAAPGTSFGSDHDPMQTQQALRAALATLQRMGNA